MPVVKDIIERFQTAFGVTINDLASKSRQRKIVNIRKIFSYVCRIKLGLTLKHTGEMINVDHTIVRYYVASYLDLYQTDKEFKQLADKVL